ncbi:hypothetical protein KP509_38G028700 [Ceratopteris richardii]|uniref:Uncharacterized protein n=1 Tax=Ceratopteris richardii TaxID=49495 RepID=A0A8T2Q3K8_CERRI|nr:hypothetical protein KP509_38G028700 [Ceratopteris richardii]KAH7278193.1 hypothetical protein KP509_38G028700 [Ceratopteris richardii]
MITRHISNRSQTGAGPSLPRLPEDAILPLPIPYSALGTSSSMVQQGLRGRFAMVHPEIMNRQRLMNAFDFAMDKAAPDYASSGSDHDPSSVSLFAMVHEFIENEGSANRHCNSSDIHGRLDDDKRGPKANGAAEMADSLKNLAVCMSMHEETLVRDSQEALESANVDVLDVCEGDGLAIARQKRLKRIVMGALRKKGYDAAVCKSKWDHLCGIPAGDYEYIDVHVMPPGVEMKRPERIFVDIHFQQQFEIVRPTDEFTMIQKLLPPIFVGREGRLKKIIHIMSDATKQSLRVKGLHLPPWRKSEYMYAKWFSSYKRTSNSIPTHPCKGGGHQQSNSLGFALRGGGLNVKDTNDLEIYFHGAGFTYLRNGVKEGDSPERGKDETTGFATSWQLPSVSPRPMVNRKQGSAMGLTSLLLRNPPCTGKEITTQTN